MIVCAVSSYIYITLRVCISVYTVGVPWYVRTFAVMYERLVFVLISFENHVKQVKKRWGQLSVICF